MRPALPYACKHPTECTSGELIVHDRFSLVSTNGSMELMPDTRRPMLPTAVASNKPTKQSVTTRFASISCPSMM